MMGMRVCVLNLVLFIVSEAITLFSWLFRDIKMATFIYFPKAFEAQWLPLLNINLPLSFHLLFAFVVPPLS